MVINYSDFVYKINEGKAKLSKNLRIDIVDDDEIIHIVLKKGFVWDGNSGSFPCKFHESNELYNIVILIHDVCYSRCSGVSKKNADNLLCKGLQLAGYSRITAEAVHIAVKLFGEKHYGSDEYLNYANGLYYVKVSKNDKVH